VTNEEIRKAECVTAALRKFIKEMPPNARIRLFEMMREGWRPPSATNSNKMQQCKET